MHWGYNGPDVHASTADDPLDQGRMLATCLHAYAPSGKRAVTHLAISPGDTLEVLRHDQSRTPRLSTPWALGRMRGLTGWFPSAYVRRIPPPGERSRRTERLMEALAGALVARREESEVQPFRAQLIDVERVRALLAGATGSDSGADELGQAQGQSQSPLSATLLGLPTVDVLSSAGGPLASGLGAGGAASGAF
jgi:hypothetical protein